MTQLRNQVAEGLDLTLNDQEANVLGPDLTIRGSRLSLQLNPRMLTLLGVRFLDCDITAKRALRTFLWHSALLEDCRFHGTFVGNDFGLRTDGYSEGGGVTRCDFSDAILDGCRFFGCDLMTIVLPQWPCFTLLNPRVHFDQMVGLEWPGQLGTWARSYSFSPPTTLASTEFAPTLMKRYEVSEEELRTAISRLGNLLDS
jgi:hypothetical protein